MGTFGKRRRVCPTGKRRYTDRLGAMIALSNTQRSNSERREEKNYYRCEHCLGWHLTSKVIHGTV